MEYQVRVSADTQTQTGSFLIELPTDDENGEISFPSGYTAATARVGFLTNTEVLSTDTMLRYMESSGYDERYKSLRGVYQEPGETTEYDTSFLIYEPNATSHPGDADSEGDYIVTSPLAYREDSGTVAETSVQDHLAVQLNSDWIRFSKEENNTESGAVNSEEDDTVSGIESGAVDSGEDNAESGTENSEESASVGNVNSASEELVITQMFLAERNSGQSDLTVGKFLEEQTGIGRFVTAGSFFSNTSVLYASLDGNGVARADLLEQLRTAGATDDAILTSLTRNTPQRVRMYIWLEGQDADCANGVSLEAAPIALSIELSGATK
jgi:hypothetical protein